MTSLKASVNANETLLGGSVTHVVGQIFCDQDLVELLNEVEPYANNEQPLTDIAVDSILIADDLFGSLAFGIDTAASYNITPAAYLTENDDVEKEFAGAGMGGGPPGGSGAPPNGTKPTGTMSVANSSSGAAVSSTLAPVSSSGAYTLVGEIPDRVLSIRSR
ncbi:hypothetical protein HBH95_184860 [Parastagonospora nodorum]|nr:hypothetical protein HBH95_184860 [Parastagonospora nodorum]